MDDFDEGFFCGHVMGSSPSGGGWIWLVVAVVIAIAVWGFATVI